MTSNAYSSVGVVQVQFADGVDVYDQVDEVRNRIRQLSDSLPDGLQGEPSVIVGGTEMLPMFTFTVEGGEDLASVTEYINDTLKPMITQLEGVSGVSVSGGSEREVVITLDTDELKSRSISPAAVYQVLSYSNTNLPLDMTTYEGKSSSLRFDAQFESLDDIRNLAVGADADGNIIRLSDVADVEIIAAEPETTITNDGKNIVLVDVTKRSDGNTMAISVRHHGRHRRHPCNILHPGQCAGNPHDRNLHAAVSILHVHRDVGNRHQHKPDEHLGNGCRTWRHS